MALPEVAAAIFAPLLRNPCADPFRILQTPPLSLRVAATRHHQLCWRM